MRLLFLRRVRSNRLLRRGSPLQMANHLWETWATFKSDPLSRLLRIFWATSTGSWPTMSVFFFPDMKERITSLKFIIFIASRKKSEWRAGSEPPLLYLLPSRGRVLPVTLGPPLNSWYKGGCCLCSKSLALGRSSSQDGQLQRSNSPLPNWKEEDRHRW